MFSAVTVCFFSYFACHNWISTNSNLISQPLPRPRTFHQYIQMTVKKNESMTLKYCREVELFSKSQQLAVIGKLATSWPELQFTFRMNVLKPELLVGCRHFTFRMNVQSHVKGQMEHWTDMQPWGCRGDMSHSQMLGKFEYTLPAKFWRLVGCTEMLSW